MVPGEVSGSHSGAAQDTDLMGCDCGNTQRHIPEDIYIKRKIIRTAFGRYTVPAFY
jgi:hypothetical protein